jgi:hypothetical protein
MAIQGRILLLTSAVAQQQSALCYFSVPLSRTGQTRRMHNLQGDDQIIDAAMARALHADACRDHALVAWVVLWDLPAYPERYAARLVTSGPGPSPYLLLADSLVGIQEQLPPDLARSERMPGDPPEVVEIWFPAYQPRDPTQVADFRGSDGGSGRMAAIRPITRGKSTAAAKIVLLDQWSERVAWLISGKIIRPYAGNWLQCGSCVAKPRPLWKP